MQVYENWFTYTHVNIPWRVGHDHMELAQDRVIEAPQVAIDPLRWEL